MTLLTTTRKWNISLRTLNLSKTKDYQQEFILKTWKLHLQGGSGVDLAPASWALSSCLHTHSTAPLLSHSYTKKFFFKYKNLRSLGGDTSPSQLPGVTLLHRSRYPGTWYWRQLSKRYTETNHSFILAIRKNIVIKQQCNILKNIILKTGTEKSEKKVLKYCCVWNARKLSEKNFQKEKMRKGKGKKKTQNKYSRKRKYRRNQTIGENSKSDR